MRNFKRLRQKLPQRNYFRLYWIFLKRSFIAKMEFRMDFFIGILGFLIENLAYLFSIYFIVRSVPSLNGWNFYQMGFLFGFTMLPIAFDHLFTDELWRIAYFRVARGDVDRYFLRPLSILFQVIAETFQPDAFGELFLGIFMLVFCGSKIQIHWSLPLVVLLLVATFVGALAITSIKIFASSFAFVFKRSGYVLQILYNFREYTRYPISIYPKVMRFVLCFILPYGLIISMPVETLFFGSYGCISLCIRILAVTAVLLAISLLVWKHNVRKYESTGS